MLCILNQCVRSRWASAACLAVVVLALALPPQGFGIPLCQFHQVTRMPCPGCGLTRSFIGLAHLNLEGAVFYNPTGVLLFPIVLFLAALLPVPGETRERVAG